MKRGDLKRRCSVHVTDSATSIRAWAYNDTQPWWRYQWCQMACLSQAGHSVLCPSANETAT
ncbi:MAG: hypothetical protein GFH27_549281n15 [Chloroflexi bacterium AL-W]|nr:hypothetical protein [Chloroflexi bacterium AL-N1]NOK65901.1 hypothetical protein [Chloroflexi bacterium AL-N10]NOK72782.1 hypothetical protein [Chloroflexi bacterium AL-N5]NOK79679.1 hypothetical protein [Chloroflexi bacterium AL-W]NOK93004.1 hypothetical protein [Chloroflexi bacterium AL-N15]